MRKRPESARVLGAVALSCALALGSATTLLGACKGAAGGAGGGGGAGGAGATKTKRASGPRLVLALHPTATRWPRTLTLHGTLDASETVQIAARVDGPIADVRVDLGDRVTQNQVLARIVATDFAARNVQSGADLEQARADLARLERLGASQLATASAIEQARTRVAVAQAQRALSGRQVADTTVRAPFRGAISRRYVSRGAFARIGTPLFDLVAVDDLRLALEVPERYAPEVGLGELVRVRPDGSAAQETVESPIVRVSPVIDAARRTFRVEASVSSEHGLRPGMFVIASIALGEPLEAVRVPRSAVFAVLGEDRVVRVVDGKAEPLTVELIGEDGSDSIVQGLTAADLIITRSGASLAPGTLVRVDAASPARAAQPAPTPSDG
jgi:membrane fusion protein (multidrug efflux system)